jgi:hypothetical protein
MANGYVPRFMQPPPGMPQRFQRLPFPPVVQRPQKTNPNALFEQPKPAFCAFPDNGPNVFQQAFSSASAAVARRLRDVSSLPHRFVNGLGNMDTSLLTEALLENSWSIIIGLLCVVVLCVLAWFFSPKGDNQTYVHPLAPVGCQCRPLEALCDRMGVCGQGCSCDLLRLLS